ncbi:hypothetical protein C7C56_022075 [Massilia glaciei]|uniref:Uncharacterized protein n=1 Tax=Massilia glaciei TaxID=1524097 RepID=A0A2U2HFA4_9BURK|nr:hypothetical protein C7C56_022075 [Massilia glaciei]
MLDGAKVSIILLDATTVCLRGDTAGIGPGTVLISTEGDGFIRKVVSMSPLQDGIRLVTVQAGLAEAFSRLDVKLDKVFGLADFGQVIATGTPEIGLKFRVPPALQKSAGATNVEVAGPELALSFNRYGASGSSGVEITGEATFKVNPQWDISLETVNAGRSVLKYHFGINPNYRHSFTAKAVYGGAISMNADIPEIVLGRFLIPNTPLVVVPTLVIAANATGSAAGAFGTTYMASVSGGATLERNITRNVSTTNSYQPLQTGSFDLAESTLSVDATPSSMKIEFRLYGVAGPNFGFDAKGYMSGTFERNAQSGQEGIRAKVSAGLYANVGAGGKLAFLSSFYKGIDGDFSVFNVPVKIVEAELADAFFPFSGAGGVTVSDNGNVPDDVFEVALDGLVLGRTSMGGSGQFRMSSLRPGTRQLSIKTVEDDSPPGTYVVRLGEGLTFAGGGVERSGGLNLGSSATFSVIVPPR